MFPHGLQRTEGPAEALANESFDGFGNLGAADSVFVVEDFPAIAADGEGEVGVFGYGIARKAMMLAQQAGAPRANGTWNDRNAIQQIEGALFEVLAGDVFEGLPASKPAIAIHHLNVASDGADLRIREVANQTRNRRGINDGVAINRNDYFTNRFGKAMVQRGGFAAVWLRYQTNTRIIPKIGADKFGGVIGGTIVNDEDFEFRIIGG